MSEPAEVRDAATVVVTRGEGVATEVLLLRRGDTAGFMAGMFVYPGGRVDAADLEAAAGDAEMAARWAAIRECFEEAGLLLAVAADGGAPAASQCDAVRSAGAPFAGALAAAGLTPSLQALQLFGRWVTPAVERRRFDTRFYLARCPEGQVAAADGFEMVEHRWRQPAEALREYAATELRLSPPTFYFLADFAEQLAAGGSLSDWAASQPLYPVLPR